MNLQDRIALAYKREDERRRERGERHLTKTELWKAAGVSSGAATQWFTGPGGMALETCMKVAPILHVDPFWLYDGSKPMEPAKPPSQPYDGFSTDFRYGHNTIPIPVGAPVPLISWVQAGHWCEAADMAQLGNAEKWLFCPVKHSSSTFALHVRGVSMEPKYRDGAIIYVDPERNTDHLSNVIVRIEGQSEVTFKQLVIEGNKRFVRPLNPDWPGPKLIRIHSDAVIFGVVIGQFIKD